MTRIHPVGEQYPISQRFGQEDAFTRATYKSGIHFGVDIACREVPLKAPTEAGVVGVVRNNPTLGNCIYLDDGTYFHRLMHLSSIDVTPGTRVTAGQVIGITGNTGLGNSYHVHWDISKKPFVFANLLTKATVLSTMVDPLVWLNEKSTNDLSTYTTKQLLEELSKRI